MAKAQGAGDGWVETTPEIIQYINPRGLGGVLYFTYRGLFVCKYGDKAESIKQIREPIGRKLHGPQEGIVSGQDYDDE